jgi:hypothetical protein
MKMMKNGTMGRLAILSVRMETIRISIVELKAFK